MSARRSAVAHSSDERLFAILREVAVAHAGDERVLAEYIREAWRVRWTYRLIGEALGMSPGRVAAIRRRDLGRRGLL